MDLASQTAIAREKFGDKVAIIEGWSKKTITFSELDEKVAILAGGLRSIGVKEGDALGCFSSNCIEVVTWVWAALRIGAHIVTVRPSFKEETVEMIVNECEVKYTLTDASREHMVPGKKILITSMPEGPPYIADGEIDENLTAAILYTSGTTGGPKGAVVSRKQIVPSVLAHIKYVKLTEGDMSIAELQLCGGFVLRNQLLTSCVVGSTVVICNNSKQMLELIENYPVTLLYQAPSFTQNVIKLAKEKYQGPFPLTKHHLRGGIISSDQATLAVHRDFYEVFGVYICEGLGMSELGTYAYTELNTLKTRDRYLGRVIDGVRLRIDSPNSSGIGEIVLSGESVCRRYVNRPQVNFVGDEFFTGDIARLDDNGDLFFEGRKNNLISMDGLKIAPIELEIPLERHELIDRAIVTKKSHLEFGEVPVAFLILKKDNPLAQAITHEELIKFLNQYVDDDILPAYFFVVDSFPLNGSGKVDRRKLTADAEELVMVNGFLQK